MLDEATLADFSPMPIKFHLGTEQVFGVNAQVTGTYYYRVKSRLSGIGSSTYFNA